MDGRRKSRVHLNDFRWSPSVIQWHYFLLLLEGKLVHLPVPKTHYAKDIVFNKDQAPIQDFEMGGEFL